MRRRAICGVLAGLLPLSVTGLAGASVVDCPEAVQRPTLVSFARLPAQTFLPDSEPSGGRLGTTPINGVAVPFADQPVQGFSGLVPNGDGSYHVLSDNGYAGRLNGADFLLRVNRVLPQPATGEVQVRGGFHLSDPYGHATFALRREDRVLTGHDFDPESVVRAPDRTYWIGEEFGPSLLHVDDAGRLLQAPVLLPDSISSPDNQWSSPANLKSSKGVEAMTTSPDGRYLYPLLEGTVAGDPEGTTRMYEFDRTADQFTDRVWRYRLDRPNYATGDAAAVDEHRLLVIERDNGQGLKAAVKKVYLLDRRVVEPDGTLRKTLLADLLNVANPRHLGGHGDPFRMPFPCVEGIVLLDERTLLLVNDNNFPSDAGRVAGVPDDNEFATIALPESLDPDPRSLSTPRP